MITGANGQLGSDLNDVLSSGGSKIIALTHQDADLADSKKIIALVNEYQPNIFINTAAFHHVDQCEADMEKAMLINATAPALIAGICKERNITFIHFSTDYVFDGEKAEPYVETDTAHPLNNYGISKRKGEEAILLINPNAIIIRVSAIYGKSPCRAKNGLNFVQLMLKKASENADLKVVDDEIVSPTSTESIANCVFELLNKNLSGIIHMTSEGSCSWYEFAQEIFNYAKTPAKLAAAKSIDFPAKTQRPKYSVLENEVLKKNDLNFMPHWKTALHLYLDQYLVQNSK